MNADDTNIMPPLEAEGSRIGPYKLLQQIGEGGFGLVFMAEQETPVRRRVALKILKLGMDTRQVIARFEAERQALAMMDHPNICRALDAGATQSGRPYFVMELVRGIPITRYCAENHLGVNERLDLFVSVCHAIQHAHLKGIIHRDIKPSNVLVTVHDGQPAAKVIDFGIAKAIEQRLTDKTLFTDLRQFVGTPDYMSPEQASLSGLDIDTRADVYSLGVLLYELLTGTRPFDSKDLLAKSFDEFVRVIREVDPPKPSTRTSITSTARGTGGGPVQGVLAADLDWIVMKTLEKDRVRRYQTAAALADDIRRYRQSEPILARPPSATYRMGKFVRRNRAGSIAALLITLATFGGAGMAYVGLLEARHQRDLARQAEADAVTQRLAQETAQQREAEQRRAAESSAAQARTEATRANSVIALVQKMLGAANPHEVKNPSYTVRELLDDFDAGLEHDLDGEPEVEATLRTTMGLAYLRLSELGRARSNLDKALALRRAALGAEHELVADSLANLGWLLHEAGDFSGAEQGLRQALAMRERLLGPEHDGTTRTRIDIGDQLRHQDRFEEAEQMARAALTTLRKVGTNRVSMADCLNTLAELCGLRGAFDEAEREYREALDLQRQVYGESHLDLASTLNNLGLLISNRGNPNVAEPLVREALAMQRKIRGRDTPEIAVILNNLGMILHRQRHHDEAVRLYREALAIQRKQVGEAHPFLARILNNLALALADSGDPAAAEPLYREAIAIVRKLLGDRHSDVQLMRKNLILALQALGDRLGVARVLVEMADYQEAERELNACLAEWKRSPPPEVARRYEGMSLLGECLIARSAFADGESMLIDGYEGLREDATAPTALKAEAVRRIIRMYELQNRPDEVDHWQDILDTNY